MISQMYLIKSLPILHLGRGLVAACASVHGIWPLRRLHQLLIDLVAELEYRITLIKGNVDIIFIKFSRYWIAYL